MVIKFTVHGFTYLHGSFDTELIKNNYLLPNNYSVSYETIVYPPQLFLIGRKQVILQNIQTKANYLANIELIYSKKGFVVSKLTLEVGIENYSTIITDLFNFDDGIIQLSQVSLQEVTMKLSEHIFGKSFTEMFFDVKLKSDHFKDFCNKFGVFFTEFETSLNLSYVVSISDEKSWEKVKQIEFEKTEGGSILKKTVILPNFDNTLVSRNPDIHILLSTGIIIYTNENILENTVNLVNGIRYQVLGLQFLKNNIRSINTDYIQLRDYFRNPYSGKLSWIYIDKTLTSLENRFENLISTSELEFLAIDDPNYGNFQNFSFKETLNEFIEYNSAKTQYIELKKHLQENLHFLRTKISDKGEKEEKMAYNRIVAVVGFLASFQIISVVLPLFHQKTIDFFRILFLFSVIPSLIIIWYFTLYNNKNKIKLAEKLQYKSKLLKEKQVLSRNLIYFKESSNREMMELSKQELDKEIALLEEKLNELELEIIKIEEKDMENFSS